MVFYVSQMFTCGLKYLYRVMYILIKCFFLSWYFFNKAYYQELYILIIEYTDVVTVDE